MYIVIIWGNICQSINSNFLNIYLFKEEREHACAIRRGWGRGRQADSPLNMEPDVGLYPRNSDHDLSRNKF